MKQSIEEIQKLPYGELCDALITIGEQVLEARAHYNKLVERQRAYTAARDLIGSGLTIGDKVQMRGCCLGRKNPMALVVEPRLGSLMFQLLRKDGRPDGEPQPEFLFEGYEKIEALPQ